MEAAPETKPEVTNQNETNENSEAVEVKQENGTATENDQVKQEDEEEGGELIMAKAFVWNLPPKTTVEELSKLFEPYGPITKCDVVKRWGFVHLTEQSELERAIKELDKTEFKEFLISVKQSRSKNPNKTKKATEGKKKTGNKRPGNKNPQNGNNSNAGVRAVNNSKTPRQQVREKARRFARIVNYELQKMQNSYDGPNFGNGYGNGNWGGFGGGGRSGPWANGNGPQSLMNRGGFGDNGGPWANNSGMGSGYGNGNNFGSGFGDFGGRRGGGGFMDNYRGDNMNRMMDRFSNNGGWSRRK